MLKLLYKQQLSFHKKHANVQLFRVVISLHRVAAVCKHQINDNVCFLKQLENIFSIISTSNQQKWK